MHVYHTWQSYVWFLKHGAWWTEFFVTLGHFLHFYPRQSKKSKFWKNENTTWRYYHFKHLYHTWKSYDVWFLRYGACDTEFFVILDCFLHFYPPNNLKNQNFEKIKKQPGDIIILHVCHKWQSYDVWFLRYETWQTEFFVILDHFLSFYPLNNPKNQNLKNWKKCLEIITFLGHFLTYIMINENHMIYGSWDMGSMWRTEFFVILDHFCPFIGRSEARRNVLEKNRWDKFRRTWKTLFGTATMNQVKLVSVISF